MDRVRFYLPSILYLLLLSTYLASRRLKEFKDTCHLFIFTLDLVTHMYPIITAVENLPCDCFAILPCDSSLGGVVVMSCNALIYVDQASRKTALAVNGWASRVSDMPMQALQPEERTRALHLEGAHATFVDPRTFFIFARDGSIYPVEVVMDGRTALRLALGPSMSQTASPSVVRSVAIGNNGNKNEESRVDVIFVGSTVGPSVLLRVTSVEVEVPRDKQAETIPAAVADNPFTMDLDDEDGACFLYPAFIYLPDVTLQKTFMVTLSKKTLLAISQTGINPTLKRSLSFISRYVMP